MPDQHELGSGCQDTGNPVLDSFVNLMKTSGYRTTTDVMDVVYEKVRELALKEPGGLQRKDSRGSYSFSERKPAASQE